MVHYSSSNKLKEQKETLDKLEMESDTHNTRLEEIANEMKEFQETREKQSALLKETERKIAFLVSERFKNESNLKELKMKMKNLTEIIQNTLIVGIIKVEDEMKYGLQNGLVDLNRDVLMRVLKIIVDKDKLRIVIGIGEVFYLWSKQGIFNWVMSGCRFHSFYPAVSSSKCRLERISEGPRWTFMMLSGNRYQTVFFDKHLSIGVYHWVIQIEYGRRENFSKLYVGAAPADLITHMKKSALGTKQSVNESCSLKLWERTRRNLPSYDSDDGSSDDDDSEDVDFRTSSRAVANTGVILGSRLLAVSDTEGTVDIEGDGGSPHGSVVGIEANVDARKLSFFINGKKMANHLSSIHRGPLCLGVTGNQHSAFTSLSFARLTSHTRSSAVCCYHMPVTAVPAESPLRSK